MNISSLPYKKSKNGVTLNIRVTPRSSKKSVEGVDGDTVNVRLTAPPKDGEANSQLIDVLSKEPHNSLTFFPRNWV
jgi:uncharacterized protein (TIGR00251 family)